MKKLTKFEMQAKLNEASNLGNKFSAQTVSLYENGWLISSLPEQYESVSIINGKEEHQFHGHARYLVHQRLGKCLGIWRKSQFRGWYVTQDA